MENSEYNSSILRLTCVRALLGPSLPCLWGFTSVSRKQMISVSTPPARSQMHVECWGKDSLKIKEKAKAHFESLVVLNERVKISTLSSNILYIFQFLVSNPVMPRHRNWISWDPKMSTSVLCGAGRDWRRQPGTPAGRSIPGVAKAGEGNWWGEDGMTEKLFIRA